MNLQLIVVVAVLVFLVTALYRDWLKPVVAFMISVAVLLFVEVITPREALMGLSNDQVAVIFLLLVISEIIRKTGTLEVLLGRLFGKRTGYRGFMARLSLSVGGISAFVNNIPVVAILMPYVIDWARRRGISPSRVLLPLSYAAIVGGTATLIGTSTNLVVNALATEAARTNAAIQPLGLFDFSPVGIPLMLVGCLYLVLFSSRLLPDRQDPLVEFRQKPSEYLFEVMVPEGSTYAGKTVERSFRHLGEVFLVAVESGGEWLTPVAPSHVIREGERLVFAGESTRIMDLLDDPQQLTLPGFTARPEKGGGEVVEAVVSANSFLMGKKVRDTRFRELYDAGIVAVRRDGERIEGSIGELDLRTGDLLLLIAGKQFRSRVAESRDLYVVREVPSTSRLDKRKTAVVVATVISALVLNAVTGIGLFKALLIPIILITLFRMISMQELKRSIDVDLFLVLVMALAVGKAIANSGAAELFAVGLFRLMEPAHSVLAALAGIYLLTNVLAMVVTSKAAVAITFPIAVALVAKLRLSTGADIPFEPFILAVAYAGCAEFITPFGYQTNLMVFGPGGYKFSDYVRFGMPLTLLFFVIAVAMLGYVYNLY